jgi:hypothetical protein
LCREFAPLNHPCRITRAPSGQLSGTPSLGSAPLFVVRLNLDRGVTPLSAARVARRILNDSNEPAAQVTRLHPIESSVGGDQPLLQRIVGARRLTRDPKCHPPGEVKIGGEEGTEGLRVTCPRGTKEA